MAEEETQSSTDSNHPQTQTVERESSRELLRANLEARISAIADDNLRGILLDFISEPQD